MTTSTPTGAVLYTDGSALPNPGFWGSGVHGYLYVEVDDKNKATKANVWHATDKGYVLQKDLENSPGKPVCVTSYIDSFSSSNGVGTNNLAEINAFSLFFENFAEVLPGLQKVHVLADSKYVIGGLTGWVKGWMRNGWLSSQGKPVGNREAWEQAYGHAEAFKTHGQLEIEWIRGHNNDFGNVKADYLASIGTNYSTDGQEIVYHNESDPLRYHKADVDLHPMLGLKRIYFNTDPDFNTPGVYYQTGWSGNDHITGKRTPEAAFSVVQLNTPDASIEIIKDAQFRVPYDFNTVVYVKLDRVKSADVYPYLQQHGRFCLARDPRNLNLNFLDQKPVTIEVLAGELPHRSIDVLNSLEEILDRFKSEYLTSGVMAHSVYSYNVHPLTDHFYDTAIKKNGKKETVVKTLKKEFKVGCLSTTVPVEELILGQMKTLHLPIVFQDDIPSRNTLKNLEATVISVFLITWRESDKLLRYSTVIQTDEGIGIWSNHFSNQLLLK